VAGSEILVEGAIAQPVIGGGDGRGGDSTGHLLGSAPVAEPLELSLQVTELFSAGCRGALHQGSDQPRLLPDR